ncbi:MAG TPA: hypothetical protein VG318_09895 [Actinomycetota bacterium]|nr:hypothetical protein [Actinomycetota bacterium]
MVLAAIMLLLALGIMLAQSRSGAAPSGTGGVELTTHQDGDPPPRCRPAGKYAGAPHPSDPSCKHKPEKHTKP